MMLHEFRCVSVASVLLLIAISIINEAHPSHAMQVRRTWTTKHWCESVIDPEWPFAYSKYKSQTEEKKGRVLSNRQDVRHECQTQGVASKCHVCEDIQCGNTNTNTSNLSLNEVCSFQLQGVSTDDMSKNIPTVSDVPWAVGGSYRYDYGGLNTSHVCMHMSGGTCQSSFALDYSHCQLRCWGYSPSTTAINTNEAGDASMVKGESSGRWPNARDDYLHGVSMTPWTLPLPTQTWSYPKRNENQIGNPQNRTKNGLESLPQGFTSTLAGGKNGEAGFQDGWGHEARFRHPEGVAVDHMGYVFVADTGNHALRMISPSGYVTTVAGNGQPGFRNGGSSNDPQFTSPSALSVWRDWEWWPYPNPIDLDSSLYKNGNGTLALFVSDTGNHQIRKVTLSVIDNESTLERKIVHVNVECFSGRCSTNGQEMHPQPGYSDGSRGEARFDSPRGLTVSDNGDVFITDTNNHLIRKIDRFGNAETIAGSTQISEINSNGKPLEGCPSPCLSGVQGHVDGDALQAKFSFPTDLALSADRRVVFVTDRHYIRSIDLGEKKVSTIAGTNREDERDGFDSEASFNKPEGITVTSDGYVYISDSASCRIRRAFFFKDLLPESKCTESLTSLFRPSGCASYNGESDSFGLKASSVSHNIYYNYVHRNMANDNLGGDYIGRGIKNCVGSPPIRKLDAFTDNLSLVNKLVVNDPTVDIREDPNEGSVMIVLCPGTCTNDTSMQGLRSHVDNDRYVYTEYSSVCHAAIHSGIHMENEGGLVKVTLMSEEANNTATQGVARRFGQVFTVEETTSSLFAVQTVSGAPSTLTESSCGYQDSIPPQGAKYRTPIGVSVVANSTLNNQNQFLFVADRNNNAIRVLSATCSFVCENGGRCIGADKCECELGWEGIDCTIPKCSDQCPNRQLCVAPDECKCIPGYEGDDCTKPTCIQPCIHGECSAPDTCTCEAGWFDSNCTTPVCEQTCGNGGNCTRPNTCTCPTEWKGYDCRETMCEQHCGTGNCVAPNTCQCPPDWSGFDCSQPVCHQGYFEPMPPNADNTPQHWLEYRPCNMSHWCAETRAFECDQRAFDREPAVPLFGQKWRYKTGRKHGSPGCTFIELASDVLTWFQYIRSWDNLITPHMRYSKPAPHNGTSIFRQIWNPIIQVEEGFTYPWTYSIDRQVALVELVNVTEGRYTCANNGTCVAPHTCACAKGWMGFDCRVPICEQGFYEKEQQTFVKGTNDDKELEIFEKFLKPNKAYRLNPADSGYSNPKYSTVVERFINNSFILRSNTTKGGERYLHQHSTSYQGGYECSIRAVTEWEEYRSGQAFNHSNYYSRYMDRKVEKDGVVYTHWNEMGWNPMYSKSSPLELRESFMNITKNTDRIYIYTDEGYRRQGVWSRTISNWTKGRCIVEFERVCDEGIKMYDLEAKDDGIQDLFDNDIVVQETDLSFRVRLSYDNHQAHMMGAWKDDDGTCTDHVIRGCFNNGTCVGPNQCQCADGWDGFDCSTPICEQTCHHNGNCTLPKICTCEKGWTGYDCSTPLCAQDCNNGGVCVAPDTCTCHQWENTWRDGRADGGVPLFQTPTGDPRLTGWTGYDCSTPICVQAEKFLLNIDLRSYQRKDLISLGGHGKDGKLSCDKVTCPVYDSIVVSNNGKSFQTGCGNDPIITGCCYELESENGTISFNCMKCRSDAIMESPHSTHCPIQGIESWSFEDIHDIPPSFKNRSGEQVHFCGPVHNPGGENGTEYYISDKPFATPYWNNRNYESATTSDRYLCNRHEWIQGDYIDDAGLNAVKGIGADFGLESGRHVRVNYNNYIRNEATHRWESGDIIPGEGIYACYNSGSCIAPDVCTCKDGYDGFDCKTPLCRHLQLNGTVVGCLNGGICVDKDICHCIQTDSILWMKHAHADRGGTGWTGQDCSTPICSQGYYDPFCIDNPKAPGGEGCYRCANAGLCVAPDVCECSEGWTGFDCQTPVCEAEVTPVIKSQLMTNDEHKIRIFENDPCGMHGFDSRLIPKHMMEPRGKCTLPNQCTCFCKETYDAPLCRFLGGMFCVKPFHDPLRKYRNVLAPNEIFGSRSCTSGYEGAVDGKDKFISCHLNIYEPSYFERHSIGIMCWGFVLTIALTWFSFHVKTTRHSKYMSAKYEKRRFQREGIVPNDHAFAFGNKEKTK